MSTSAETILKKHGLKNTRQRKVVLEEFSRTKNALSQPELEKRLKGEMDRVTLYRILSSFQENGILHSILDLNGTTNYAICSPACSTAHHKDEHVHFNCTNCQRIYCLEVKVPDVTIPVNFRADHFSLIVTGLCENCILK